MRGLGETPPRYEEFGLDRLTHEIAGKSGQLVLSIQRKSKKDQPGRPTPIVHPFLHRTIQVAKLISEHIAGGTNDMPALLDTGSYESWRDGTIDKLGGLLEVPIGSVD